MTPLLKALRTPCLSCKREVRCPSSRLNEYLIMVDLFLNSKVPNLFFEIKIQNAVIFLF